MRAITGFRASGRNLPAPAFCGPLATGDMKAEYTAGTRGYWGPHVGFYGGVNYGFGFGGVGFAGGEWRGGVFAYNSAVANFGSVHVTNVYENRTIVEENTIVNVNHVSFNGGVGIQVHASAVEMQAANEHHFEATCDQVQHEHFAAQDRSQLASVNQGRPATMASSNVKRISPGGAAARAIAAHLVRRSLGWAQLQSQQP